MNGQRLNANRLSGLIAFAISAIALLPVPGAQAENTPAPQEDSEIKQFCSNIADSVRDQRYLLQKQELEKLQADVNERIKLLEAGKNDYAEWLKQRNDFLKTADEGLISIYKVMKPDAAAGQLSQVNTRIAAAIMMKLPPKMASMILTEMNNQKAAELTSMIAATTAIPEAKATP
jgi:flagellar motility protein MotE (MotC chaperone)